MLDGHRDEIRVAEVARALRARDPGYLLDNRRQAALTMLVSGRLPVDDPDLLADLVLDVGLDPLLEAVGPGVGLGPLAERVAEHRPSPSLDGLSGRALAALGVLAAQGCSAQVPDLDEQPRALSAGGALGELLDRGLVVRNRGMQGMLPAGRGAVLAVPLSALPAAFAAVSAAGAPVRQRQAPYSSGLGVPGGQRGSSGVPSRGARADRRGRDQFPMADYAAQSATQFALVQRALSDGNPELAAVLSRALVLPAARHGEEQTLLRLVAPLIARDDLSPAGRAAAWGATALLRWCMGDITLAQATLAAGGRDGWLDHDAWTFVVRHACCQGDCGPALREQVEATVESGCPDLAADTALAVLLRYAHTRRLDEAQGLLAEVYRLSFLADDDYLTARTCLAEALLLTLTESADRADQGEQLVATASRLLKPFGGRALSRALLLTTTHPIVHERQEIVCAGIMWAHNVHAQSKSGPGRPALWAVRHYLGEVNDKRYRDCARHGARASVHDLMSHALPGGTGWSPPSEATPLSRRETEVAGLVADGLTNEQIARRLGISRWTVVNHLRSIMRKMKCLTRVEVATRVVTADLPLVDATRR